MSDVSSEISQIIQLATGVPATNAQIAGWTAAVDKRGGTTSFAANTLDNWRDVRHVFEAWGVLLRERLQQAGVCRK